VHRANVQPGEWVLIHAAAGGVGLAAVQVAKAKGATVIAAAGTPRKRKIAQDFGADYATYRLQRSQLARCGEDTLCGTRVGYDRLGVDVVYDPVGMIEMSLKCVTYNARLLVIVFAAGIIEKVALNRVLLKNASLVGHALGPISQVRA
jgi:NADPH:quinone reductase